MWLLGGTDANQRGGLMEQIITNAWAQGGAVLLGLLGGAWVVYTVIAAGNKRENYIMGEWTDKLKAIHHDVHLRGDQSDENQITTTMVLVGVQEQLTGIIGRSYRIDKREGSEDVPSEWLDANQQMARYNKTGDRIIGHLESLLEQRKQEAQKRELRVLEKRKA